MFIISQNTNESELSNAVSSFFSAYHIGNLLRKCNASKKIDVIEVRGEAKGEVRGKILAYHDRGLRLMRLLRK